MAMERLIAAQMIRLFDQNPGVIWQVLAASSPLRAGDVTIRDLNGNALAHARPVPDVTVARPIAS